MKSITHYTSLAYIWQEKNSILFCGGIYNAAALRRGNRVRQQPLVVCRARPGCYTVMTGNLTHEPVKVQTQPDGGEG